MKLTREQAIEVWTVLVRSYGAPNDEWSAVRFMVDFTRELSPSNLYNHNKFIGFSGSGNIEVNTGGLHAWYTSDYRTPANDIMFEKLNKELQMLWKRFKTA